MSLVLLIIRQYLKNSIVKLTFSTGCVDYLCGFHATKGLYLLRSPPHAAVNQNTSTQSLTQEARCLCLSFPLSPTHISSSPLSHSSTFFSPTLLLLVCFCLVFFSLPPIFIISSSSLFMVFILVFSLLFLFLLSSVWP